MKLVAEQLEVRLNVRRDAPEKDVPLIEVDDVVRRLTEDGDVAFPGRQDRRASPPDRVVRSFDVDAGVGTVDAIRPRHLARRPNTVASVVCSVGVAPKRCAKSNLSVPNEGVRVTDEPSEKERRYVAKTRLKLDRRSSEVVWAGSGFVTVRRRRSSAAMPITESVSFSPRSC